ncbi:hypothetical protein [Amycolatopsis sp. MEPSY49]|uniref:hypothetical protein n=1 Tax=Amycolatopsis sp. MEPSY49 TaxID=3151600 RepID=UPI003EF476E9
MHPQLLRIRRDLRTACGEAGIPAGDRARLILAATLLAEPAIEADRKILIETSTADRRPAVTFRLPEPVGQARRHTLPLLPDAGDDATVTWHFATGRIPQPAPAGDEAATREEMLALVARADARR